MAVPEVNKMLLGELEEMGFPLTHAIRALYSSGNSSLDAAVNWLFEHENDADICQLPSVIVNINIESLDMFQVTEEVKLKALELRERAQTRKEHGNKKSPKEIEKERKSVGKEVLETMRSQEENERMRHIENRKAEQEMLERERERIRHKIEQDKVERRCRLGLPLVDVATMKHEETPTLEKKESFLEEFINTHIATTKAELMRDCLRSLKINHMDEGFAVRRAFQTLMTYVKNVVRNPQEEKFRKIRIANPAFQERVGKMEEAIRFLELCGFERGNGAKFMFLPIDKVDMAALVYAGTVLNAAITNPYFAMLSKKLKKFRCSLG